jgi:uncharacterized damage-inducible protein DinB
MPTTTLLDEALEAWRYTRTSLIREIENLSGPDLAFRPHEKSRTAAEIAFHLAESCLMMAGELSRPDGNFRRKSFPQFIKEYAGHLRPTTQKAEVVRLLRRTHAGGSRKIRAAGELHMLQQIRQFDGQPSTRLAWMHHGIAHEEYHRGQIALYARLRGRVPALTQLIHGASA